MMQENSSTNSTGFGSSFRDWFTNLRWIPSSLSELEQSEKKIYSHLQRKFKTYAVDISNNSKEERKIWTIEMESDSQSSQTPLLLIHGLCLGAAVWVLNLDELSKERKVYAIDMLGFGRSSRPDFSKIIDNPEFELVDAIEAWRQKISLNQKFIILGHSFGAYCAATYSIRHGQNLDRLVLLDPWGFSDKLDIIQKIPFLTKGFIKFIFLAKMNPMIHIRAAGPAGRKLMVEKDDVRKKYESKLAEDSYEILNYIYHTHALKPVSGEKVFKQICTSDLIARNPIIHRSNKINSNIKLNFIYGKNSLNYKEKEEYLRELFPKHHLEYKIFENSGHHIYVDEPNELNSYLNSL